MDHGNGETTFALFWLYKAAPEWRRLPAFERAQQRDDFARRLDERAASLTLRGAYSLAGLRHDADMLLWLHGPDLGDAQELAVALRKSDLGSYLENVYTYTGLVPVSRYAPEHRPAFIKGQPPRSFLSIYPFTKTAEWYLLPFDERRRLMAEHGRMGQAHSALPEVRIDTGEPASGDLASGDLASGDLASGDLASGDLASGNSAARTSRGAVLANTVHSFGLGDQEFVVAFESDDPAALERMVEDLRAAEVRRYTASDTPIFLGRRNDVRRVLDDLG